jgi:hypothetical protein
MSGKKEPPDKYRCLKLPISSILFKNKEKEEGVKENMDFWDFEIHLKEKAVA